MESWLAEAANQIPSLLVLVFLVLQVLRLVHKFISFIEARDAAWLDREAKRDTVLQGIADQCHAATAHNTTLAATAIQENTRLLSVIGEKIERMGPCVAAQPPYREGRR